MIDYKQWVQVLPSNSRYYQKVVGFIATCFPIVCLGLNYLTGFDLWEHSVSATYYGAMRTLFIGPVCILAFFMSLYKGYDFRDQIVSTMTAIFLWLVAIFPCGALLNDVFIFSYEFDSFLHLTGAIGVVITQFLQSLLFAMTHNKKKRLIIMLLSSVMVLSAFLMYIVFGFVMMEVTLFISLGVMWLVKYYY